MKKSTGLTFALLFSIAFHAVTAVVLWALVTFEAAPEKRVEATVEFIEPEQIAELMKRANSVPDPQGQIVEQDKQLNDEIDENTRYMSKFNQKVVRETQAALNGQFKNSSDKGGEKKPEEKLGKESESEALAKSETAKEKSEEPSKTLTSVDGIPTGKKPSLKDLTPSFRPGAPRINADQLAQGGGEGPSATDDHLKDVKVGMETMLSTREFVYYSYYNRIKDKLRQYWQPKIKEKVERIFRQGRTIASNGNKITKIIIVLDEKGVLQKVQVIGPSGVTDLDDAAVEAFRAAAPFPNPPSGIVDQDGTIKIRWDFILEADVDLFAPEHGYARN